MAITHIFMANHHNKQTPSFVKRNVYRGPASSDSKWTEKNKRLTQIAEIKLINLNYTYVYGTKPIPAVGRPDSSHT